LNSVASGFHEGPAESIGQRLRRLRHERGFSQRELAGPGVSYAYISRIEAGARRPSVKALRMLARKLGVSADYLETGSELRDTDERELKIADAELELRLAEHPDEAEAKLAVLRDEAVDAGDTVAAARATIALGLAAASAGRTAATIERLEAGLERFQVSPSARPDVFATLGRAYSASGRPDLAVELFERCLEELAASAPDDVAAQLRFTSYLSYALTDRGDLERAQEVLDEVLDKAEEPTDAYSRVRLYWSLARLSELQGKSVAALDYIRRAIALLDVTDDTLHLGRAHLLCGTIMLSQGRTDEARRHIELAERLFGPHPEPEDRANLYTDHARLAVKLGRADEAIARARAALDAAGDDYLAEKGNAQWALAEGLSLTDDVDAADAAYGEATTLLGAHGLRRDHVEAYRSWGEFLRGAGREDEALEVLERAADLAAEPAGDAQSHRAPQ
jgi:tetratricopeptide (TPR) repeat protein